MAYADIDDFDIVMALKNFRSHDDFVLSTLSKNLIDRRLFKIELSNQPFEGDYVSKIRRKVQKDFSINLSTEALSYLVFEGKETNSAYSTLKDEIKILYKDGRIVPMSDASDSNIQSTIITKYYLVYPKKLQ